MVTLSAVTGHQEGDDHHTANVGILVLTVALAAKVGLAPQVLHHLVLPQLPPLAPLEEL